MTDTIDTSWYDQALCKGHPTEWWFPTHGMSTMRQIQTRKAKAICFVCPVKESCYMAGTKSHSSGIWGGRTLYNGRDNKRGRKKKQ